MEILCDSVEITSRKNRSLIKPCNVIEIKLDSEDIRLIVNDYREELLEEIGKDEAMEYFGLTEKEESQPIFL
jgi:hypothetical protein